MFHPFNDELGYALAHYFAESETTKGNVDKSVPFQSFDEVHH